MHWKKISLIGVGLLGGSLGLAAKRRRLAESVQGYVRRKESVQECLNHGVADAVTLDVKEAVAGADLIIFCTPISQMRPLAEAMKEVVSPGVLVTDVGSVKASVIDELEPIFAERGAHFVGSHPMAGSERTGVAEAREGLFDGATCVVTATERTPTAKVHELMEFWQAVGGVPLPLDPAFHDALVGRASHLPHLVASGLAHLVLDPREPKEQAELCATGFADTTRIASGSPSMWRDICAANREELSLALGKYMEMLADLQQWLSTGRDEDLEAFLREAKQRRDAWRGLGRKSSAE